MRLMMALACSPCPPLASWPLPAPRQGPRLRCPPGRQWRSLRESEPWSGAPPAIRHGSCHVLSPQELHRAWSEPHWGLLHTQISGKHPQAPSHALHSKSTQSRAQLSPKGTTGTMMGGFHASSVHGRMGQDIPDPARMVSLAPLTHLL